MNKVDILENDILQRYPDVLAELLRDHTTERNIFWATNDYEERGEGYAYDSEITIESITGENDGVIKPRVLKSKENQTDRSKEMAEVFTPSWVCNAQNNLVDNAWFGRENVFNVENVENHTWIPTEDPIINFPNNKSWRDYINENRLEMTCGEAPYLVSRYDTTTGEFISLKNRIGLLDRKLRLVNENTPNLTDNMTNKQRKQIYKTWKRAAICALQSIYGFEYQGDNLLLARESIFCTFIEYYQEKFKTKKHPQETCLRIVAQIISWNIWQMDGLTYGLPGQNTKEIISGLNFIDTFSPTEKLCRIMEWKGYEPLRGDEIVFASLINNNKL